MSICIDIYIITHTSILHIYSYPHEFNLYPYHRHIICIPIIPINIHPMYLHPHLHLLLLLCHSHLFHPYPYHLYDNTLQILAGKHPVSALACDMGSRSWSCQIWQKLLFPLKQSASRSPVWGSRSSEVLLGLPWGKEGQKHCRIPLNLGLVGIHLCFHILLELWFW